MILSTLEDLLQIFKTMKQNSDDAETARHWAVAYTLLEGVYAYVKTYLITKENEDA